MKRTLCILCALALCLTLMPTAAFAAGTDTGKAIQLGTSGISDPTSTQISSGKTYYTPSDYVYFGVNGSTPIKWRVLDADKANDGTTSGMFLLSEYLLDSGVVFESARTSDDNDGQSNPNDWQHSDAQNWCSTFATTTDVFSTAEQAAFLGVVKTDSAERLYNIPWGESSLTVQDKMFFLSARELTDYVGSYDGAPGLRATDTAQSAGGWWLRSPDAGSTGGYAGLVNNLGVMYSWHVDEVWAARPAFNLDLNSVLLTSAAAGGKEGDGGLKAVTDYTDDEWKLTLLDDSRGFAISDAKTNASGDAIAFSYSGAQTGEKEYISVVIEEGGAITYYGRILQLDGTTNGASGTASLTLPAGVTLDDDTKLYVFNEQYNGGENDDTRLTDYGSRLIEVVNPTVDDTAPALSNDSATRDSDTTATVKFTSDEAGTYYYIAQDTEITLTNAEIAAQGTKQACSAGENEIELDNLTASAWYAAVVVKDAVGNVSEILNLTIPAPTYSISTSPAELDFGSKTVGYTEAPAAQTVTITNTGNQTVTVDLPAGTNYTITAGEGFETATATLAPTDMAAFTVQPNTGLAVGDYSGMLTISGSNGAGAEVSLAFTVEPISIDNDVSRIVITPDGYRLGSDATLVPYTGAYVLTGSAGGNALDIYNGSGVEQTFDITFDNLQIQAGEWEGAVAISSETSADTIVLNLYSLGTCLVRSGNHTALASRGDTEAPRIINLSVLDGTLTLETQNSAGGGFAWSSDYNTTFNLVNTVTIDGASSFTNSDKGSVTLKPDYQYTSNNDGTHQRTLGENSVTEDCSFQYELVEGTEQHRQVCIHCGYQTEPESCIPSGEWIAKDEQYHGKICSICGQIVSLERHADLDNDFKCDYCGIVILAEPDQTEGVYQISNIAELYWFAALVNGTLESVPQNTEADAVLTADIVINEQVLTADGELVEDTDGLTAWTPIGSGDAPFDGTFDGQGHSISGLYINRPEADCQGLFGYISSNGTVSRTEVTGSYIHGHNGVGGITGINSGTLTACSYSGTVIGYDYSLGGVAGGNDGTVSCCYATGKVHGTGYDSYVGGVVCDNYGIISSCYSTASLSADYIGGIALYNEDGYITGSYYLQGSADKGVDENRGTVENVESRTAEQFAGGEVAWLLNGQSDENPIWFQTLGTDTLPVLDNTHGTVYATGNCPGDMAYNNEGPSTVGEHTDSNGDHKCDYCGIVILAEPDQTEGVYQISNIAELYWFAALVNGTLEGVLQNTEADAVLTADIVINEQVLTADGELVEDTDGLTAWTPIGSGGAPFDGTFDGQGHSISGLYINRPEADWQGLFGYIDVNGNVSRTEVTGSYIHGHNGVGGITGINSGILTACSYSGTVIGYDYPLGGVVGGNDGTVSCCYATGKVHATGYEPYVGGVVGDNYGTISSCYSTASLSADYSDYIGGIASYNDGRITGSYYLQGSADKGVDENGGTVENVESRTAEQFAGGEVTWLLQHAITDDTQIWGQNLPADTLPVLLSEHRVYAALFIHEATDLQMMGKYGNLNAQIPLPTAEELGANGEVSFTDSFGNPLTETLTLLSDTVILVNCRLYSITVSNSILHGDISVPYDSCNAGAEVAVEAFPYNGYEPFMLRMTTSDGQEYEYEDLTFTMPAADVILSADFIPYLYDATYTISENDNGYNVMLTWDYDASDCHTEIHRDGTLVHTTAAGETSWQDQVSEAGVYNYTLYVENAQGVRSRGTLLTVYAYPSTPMGTSGTQSVDLGDVPELFTDDGGRNGNYSNDVDATAVITAQEDCRIYLTGNCDVESGWDYLSILDSNNSRLGEYSGKGTIEPALLSSGNTLTVWFTSDASITYKGFELYVETVYPVTIAEVENGTVEADTAWARAGDMVTLTPVPNEQNHYVEGSLKVLKADDPTVEILVNADGSFTMPAFKIIVTAAFERSTALSVPEIAAWNVFGTDGMLHITGTEAEAEVYDVRGVLVYRGMGRNLYLPTGVYIVRAEGQVQKAIVK